MERLTKPAVHKTGNKYVSAIGSSCGAWPRIIQRLADYENTGLEPEEIVALQAQKIQDILFAKMDCSDADVEELRKQMREAAVIIPTQEPSIEFVQHGWIPVTERLPETTSLCIVTKYRVPFLAWYTGKNWRAADTVSVVDGITHWMPLPEPPKEDK